MTKTPTFKPVTNRDANASEINQAIQSVADQFEKTLFRDGTTPNHMQSDMDLNSNDILNGGNIYTQKVFLGGDELTASFYPSFELRSEFVEWKTSNTLANGVVVFAGGLPYVFDSSSTSISDLPGVEPYGSPYVDHFGDNTIPGTTNCTSLIVEFVTYMNKKKGVGRLRGVAYNYDQGVGGFLTINSWQWMGDTGAELVTTNTASSVDTLRIGGTSPKISNIKFSGYPFIRPFTGTDIEISDCEITCEDNFPDTTRQAVQPLNTADIDGLKVLRNRVHHCPQFILTASSFGNGGVGQIRNFDISGNIVYMMQNETIVLNSDPDDATPGRADAWKGGRVHANKLTQYYGSASGSNRPVAVSCEGAENTVISENYIEGYGVKQGLSGDLTTFLSAVHIEQHNKNITVAVNTFENVDRAIEVYGQTTGVVVSGNTANCKLDREIGDDPSTYPVLTATEYGPDGRVGVHLINNTSLGADGVVVTENVMVGFEVGYMGSLDDGDAVISGNSAVACTTAFTAGRRSRYSHQWENNIARQCLNVFGFSTTSSNAVFGKQKVVDCINLFDTVNDSSAFTIDGLSLSRTVSMPGALSTYFDLFPTPSFALCDGEFRSQVSNNDDSVYLFTLDIDTVGGVTYALPANKSYDSPLPRANLAASNSFRDNAGTFQVRIFQSGATNDGEYVIDFTGRMVWHP